MAQVTLLKLKVMQKLDGTIIIVQLKVLEPSKHLQNNIEHCFTWTIVSNTPKNAKTRKNLEASCNPLWKPGPN